MFTKTINLMKEIKRRVLGAFSMIFTGETRKSLMLTQEIERSAKECAELYRTMNKERETNVKALKEQIDRMGEVKSKLTHANIELRLAQDAICDLGGLKGAITFGKPEPDGYVECSIRMNPKIVFMMIQRGRTLAFSRAASSHVARCINAYAMRNHIETTQNNLTESMEGE